MQSTQAKHHNKLLPLVAGLLFAGHSYAIVEFEHDPIEEAPSGKRIEVEAEVSAEDSADSVSEVRTYFRADKDSRWHYVPMREDGDDYKGILPAPDIHTSFIRYQLLSITQQRQLAKTEIFNIEVDKDEDALERLERKEPRDVKIDVSELQDMEEAYEQYEKASAADKANTAEEAGQPESESRVDVRSENNPLTDTFVGFDDYVNLTYTGGSKAFGTAAGIVSTSTAATAIAPKVTGVTSVAASSGGSVWPWVLGGVVVAGGAAAASSGGGGGNGGGNGGGGGGGGGITDFSGRTLSPTPCPGNTGNAVARYVVDLNQAGEDVTGIIAFHDCPGGGRAEYNVTGTATTDPTIDLDGTLSFTAGPLGGTAPANQTFTVAPGGAPDPNFAP